VLDELERAIYQWLAAWNNEPRPFVWKATADVILDKISASWRDARDPLLHVAHC
jgi:hypothetical protein